VIGHRRHARALRKELRFWRRSGIISAQDFRVRRYDEMILEAAARAGVSSSCHILDVGSGPTCCASIIESGSKWYVDPLLDEYAKLRNLPEGMHLAAPIEDVSLPAAHFELAISLNAIDHVRDPIAALTAVYRALKPGGVFLCTVYTRHPLFAFVRNVQEAVGLSTDVAHPYSFSADRMSAALVQTGFVADAPAVVDSEWDRCEMVWFCRKRE
jgi:SAM-dependent methyltransferase